MLSFPRFLSEGLVLCYHRAMKISKGLRQAYELQDFTYEATLALKRSLTKRGRLLQVSREDASAISSLVKAWELCQERIRIHRNKPMPGVLRPENKKASVKRTQPRSDEVNTLQLPPGAVQTGSDPDNPKKPCLISAGPPVVAGG